MYGRMPADGRGIPADLEAARAWISRAAASGLTEAQVALAEMMVNSRGGPRDMAGALELFEKAAAERHSGAMLALGALYAGGHGQAELMLGPYLVDGAAGEANRVEARSWFEHAAAQGN